MRTAVSAQNYPIYRQVLKQYLVGEARLESFCTSHYSSASFTYAALIQMALAFLLRL